MVNILKEGASIGPASEEFAVHEYAEGRIRHVVIPLSMEYTVAISINGSPYAAIACSGSDLREMVLGHLVSEGFVRSMADIREMNFDKENMLIDAVLAPDMRIQEKLQKVRRISACGKGHAEITRTKSDDHAPLRIGAETVISVMDVFLNRSQLRTQTWGVHSAALASMEGEIIAFYDEIGRHNAVDKVLGYALLNGIDLHKNAILTTGRISSEIITKLINASSKMLISRATPTSLSRELAGEHGITMIGRVRSGYFCIFSGHENVIITA